MLCTNSIQTPVTHTLYTKIVNIKETTLWDLIGLGFLSEVTHLLNFLVLNPTAL